MKNTTAFLLTLFIAYNGFCQEQDSAAFVHAKWQQTRIARGVQLKQYRFEHSLFGSNQHISILEVRLRRKNRIDVAADPKMLKATSLFGTEQAALAALNGTFFDMKNGGSEDYIRLDGTVLNETKPAASGLRKFHQKAAIITNGNKVSILAWDGTADWEHRLPGEDVMVTGPLLVRQHQRETMDTIGFYTARHPRTALAIKGNTLLLLTVDGRNQKAVGMSLPELAHVLQWLDVTDGINLDGGGSTTLWVKGSVANYPSDNKKMEKSPLYTPGMDLDKLPPDTQKWDHTGERPVANVLLINRKK